METLATRVGKWAWKVAHGRQDILFLVQYAVGIFGMISVILGHNVIGAISISVGMVLFFIVILATIMDKHMLMDSFKTKNEK